MCYLWCTFNKDDGWDNSRSERGKGDEIYKIKNAKKWTLSVLLEFEKAMPKKIRVGYSSYDFREYILAPMRCFDCQRMGHNAKESKDVL